MKYPVSKIFFALSTVFFSLVLISLWFRNAPARLQFESFPETTKNTQSIKQEKETQPVAISIQSVDITLPVYEALVSKNKWQTTRLGVSYVSHSGKVGKSGNAIFYGHNWPNLLGNLQEVKPGDYIDITLGSGAIARYQVATTQEVSSENVSVLAETTDYRITLYTCSGFLDTKRFVVVGEYIHTRASI